MFIDLGQWRTFEQSYNGIFAEALAALRFGFDVKIFRAFFGKENEHIEYFIIFQEQLQIKNAFVTLPEKRTLGRYRLHDQVLIEKIIQVCFIVAFPFYADAY